MVSLYSFIPMNKLKDLCYTTTVLEIKHVSQSFV